MKKSQVSHVFIFALGIIILALILIFGYKVVDELRVKGEETTLIHLKTELKNDIAKIKLGDISKRSYTIPRGYREVCFVDEKGILTGTSKWTSELHGESGGQFLTNEPELSNAIVDRVKDNVFLVGESKVDSLFIGDINLGRDSHNAPIYAVYCFEIKNSKLNIQLEGKGDNVLITKQS